MGLHTTLKDMTPETLLNVLTLYFDTTLSTVFQLHKYFHVVMSLNHVTAKTFIDSAAKVVHPATF